MKIQKLASILSCATAVAIAAPASLKAEQAFGLTTSGSLFFFDTIAPNTVSSPTAITGLGAGQSLRGIDFRPANNALYGFATNAAGTAGQVYTINPLTGAAVSAGASVTLGGPAAGVYGIDFNPVVDRLRVVGNTGGNYRFNPVGGALVGTDTNIAYNGTDFNSDPDFSPAVVSVAYSNNVAGAAATTLYDYDFSFSNLAIQGTLNGAVSPNTGVLNSLNNTTGSTNLLAADSNVGFDISSATGVAFLSARVTTGGAFSLYTADLTTGVTTAVGALGGLSVQDIALSISPIAVPEPGVYVWCFGGLALGAVVLRRRHARV